MPPQPLPSNLRSGYYLVRKGGHWAIALWLPSRQQWSLPRGELLLTSHWDEIGAKVA
jgi:hypothetical protein